MTGVRHSALRWLFTLLLLVLWGRVSCSWAAGTTYCDTLSGPLPIPDDDATGISDTITVSDNTTIADLNVSLAITHTFVGDLVVILTHVDTATSVILIQFPEVQGIPDQCANIMCTLSDQGDHDTQADCASTPAIGGTVIPLRPLEHFAGQSIAGTWKLQVLDEAVADSGTLDTWCLALTSETPPPTPTPTSTPGVGRVYCDSLPGPLLIPDNDPNGITTTVTVPDSTTITDLAVGLDITHSFVGDLVATLTHVDTGATAALIDRPGTVSDEGCDSADIMSILDDRATRAAETECSVPPPAIACRVQPNTPLSVFAGEQVGGTWKLQVSDNAELDNGTLDSWCLRVNVPVVTGDSNGDGDISAADIPALVRILSAGEQNCDADVNDDGVVDFFDLDGTVSLIFDPLAP